MPGGHNIAPEARKNCVRRTRETIQPLHKVGNAPNFIRQIFNGRKHNDLCGLPCAQETRFFGRPKGVRSTERGTKKRTTERHAFSRVSAISRPAPLFCILFSGKTEKSMPAERQLRCHRKKGTAVPSQKRPAHEMHGLGRSPLSDM